ncbi:hypothetical protein EUTSA_v10023653mg [Eutrema salsugineum]|uniref:Uncharacterized protein n=1 Tax=Eutrema salsugineum TaxID=72664 RepID=V4KPR9_EUTSA|nr:hypothetical protein EUTSA_v10023653mg [Eutrema salsugineum]
MPNKQHIDFALGKNFPKDDGFRREQFDQKGSTHSLSKSGSIHEISAPSARMDNPSGRLTEMDFSAKDTGMPRSEDKISDAVFSNGQKLLLASKIPDSQAQNQVSGSQGNEAGDSGSDGDCVGANSASGSGNETEESNGDGVRHKGAKSASVISESYKGAEESNGDITRHERLSTPEIVPSKVLANRRAVYQSDCMKTFWKVQAEIGRVNPEESLPSRRPYNKSLLTKKNHLRFDSFWKKGVVDQRLVDL